MPCDGEGRDPGYAAACQAMPKIASKQPEARRQSKHFPTGFRGSKAWKEFKTHEQKGKGSSYQLNIIASS